MELSELLEDDFCGRAPITAPVLPRILRDKLTRHLEQQQISVPGTLLKDTLTNRLAEEQDSDRTYTTSELEDELERVNAALHTSQRQIQMSEEAYYDETAAHGNLFAGWDGFIDNRDIGAGNNGGSVLHHNASTASMRRMPPDYRWFSGSSSNNGGRNSKTNNDEQSRYLTPMPENEGTPVTVLTEEEEAAATQEPTISASRSALTTTPNQQDKPASDLAKLPSEDEQKDAPGKAHEESNADQDFADDNKRSDKKGKRKAAATPASTRPKRQRK